MQLSELQKSALGEVASWICHSRGCQGWLCDASPDRELALSVLAQAAMVLAALALTELPLAALPLETLA